MNTEDCFPEYFAIKKPDGYHVFQNTVYKAVETHHMSASVLWPSVNVSIGLMNKFSYSESDTPSLTRKWNGYEYNPCKWRHTGFELEMTKVNGVLLIIPVLKISEEEGKILPYNNRVYTPTGIIDKIQARRGTDIKARVFTTEPVDSVPCLAGTRQKHGSTQLITKIELKIPQHVKKLLIHEAVRNKELCPISCEDITEENADVTSCGHVFIANEIKTWLSMESSKCLCPVCKQKCSV